MSITGNSSGDAWETSRSSWAWTSSPQSVGGPRAGETRGDSSGSPRCVRIFRMGPGSVMNAMSRMSSPHPGHWLGLLQARLRRRHIENPPQARPARAMPYVEGSGTPAVYIDWARMACPASVGWMPSQQR